MLRHIGTIVVCLSIVSAVAAQPPNRNRLGGDRNDESGEYRPLPGQRGGPEGPVGPMGPGGPPPIPMFDAIDADSDGTISARELRRAAAALKKLDTDKDGNITREEALGSFPGGPMAGPAGEPNAMVERLLQGDRNGDGVLTRDEVPRQMAQMLQGADTNGDGALDRAELVAAMERGANRFGGPGVDPRRGQDLMQYDQNGDGQLSADEVPARLQGMLQGSDQNGNGVLDAAEVQVINQRLNERIRGQRKLPPGISVGPHGVGRDRNAE